MFGGGCESGAPGNLAMHLMYISKPIINRVMQPIPDSSLRFSNVQMELLKLFSRDVPKADLTEIKRLLAHYFAAKLSRRADQVWNKQGWTDEKMDELLNTKMRRKSA